MILAMSNCFGRFLDKTLSRFVGNGKKVRPVQLAKQIEALSDSAGRDQQSRRQVSEESGGCTKDR